MFKKIFFHFFNLHRSRYLMGALSVVLLDAIEMAPPIIVKKISEKIHGRLEFNDILFYCAGIMGCYVLIAFLRFAWRYFIVLSAQDIEVELRNFLYDKILSAKYSKLVDLKVGDTVSLFNQDVMSIRAFMGPGILIIFDTIAYLIFIPATLFYVLGAKAFFIFSPFVLLTIAVFLYQKPIEKLNEAISSKLGKVSDHIFEESIGAKFFKVLRLFSVRFSKFEFITKDIFKDTISLNRFDVSFEATIQLIILISFSFLFYSIYNQNGNMLIGFGAIAVAVQLLNKLVWPMMAVSYVQNFYQGARAASNRLGNLYQLEGFKNGQDIVGKELNNVEIKNLNFSHQGSDKLVLKNINLKISKGQKIAVTGAVGSGKSTLLKILASIYGAEELQYDHFLINGISFEKINKFTYRQHLSYIPQEIQIFSDSIKRNLSPDLPFSEARFQKVIDSADLSLDLFLFKDGLSTMIGEKGINLSGGQKQRICIARSFYQGASLFLWDDTISALDQETEQKIINTIFRENPEAILVLCTHRLSTLTNFDKVYVLDGGTVVEEGSYDELMSKGKYFYRLKEFESKTSALTQEVPQ